MTPLGKQRILHRAWLALSILGAAVFVLGCASSNVNPLTAKPRTGYMDFFADYPGELCWNVQQFDARSDQFRKLFCESRPVEGGILRLGFRPGQYCMQITFLNQVISEPALIDVEVQEGRISPVQVRFTEIGSTSVLTKETHRGSTVRGRYGRSTRIGNYETKSYVLTVALRDFQTYQLKERMPYAPPQSK